MRRKKYIDILKIISAFCIVMLHVNSNSLHLIENSITDRHYIIANLTHQLLYLAVPVFITLSGCGLLVSGNTDYRKMWPKIRRVLLCIVLFGIIFELSRIVIRKENISAKMFLTDLLNGTTWSHMWFLNKLLGFYLIVPVLGAFIQKSNRASKYVLTGICLLFTSVLPFLASIFKFEYTDNFAFLGMFITYAMIGYLIDTVDVKDKKKMGLVGLAISLTGILIIAIWASKVKYLIILEGNPVAVFTVIGIVMAFKGFISDATETGTFLKEMSVSTFGIYIIHPILIHIVISVFRFNPQTKLPFLMVPVCAIAIFITSFAFVWMLRKIPFIKKYLI